MRAGRTLTQRSYSIPPELIRTAGGARLRVYVALAERLNHDGKCWPLVATLAADAGVKDRSVAYALGWLEANGWVQREHRQNQSTIFTLPHLSRSSPVQGSAPLQTPALLQDDAGVQELAVGGAKNGRGGVQEVADRTPLSELLPITPPKSTKKRRPAEAAIAIESLTDDERSLWLHYCKTRKHLGFRAITLTDKRRTVMSDALAIETLEVLMMAVAGLFRSPHHLGQNDRKTTYLDIDYAIGSSKKITTHADAWERRNVVTATKPAGAGGRMSASIQRQREQREQRSTEGGMLLLLAGGAS